MHNVKLNKQHKVKKNLVAEIAGWYGMSAIVGAYALVSFGLVDAESVVYQLLNLTGALGIIWISFVKRVWQSVTLNLFWCAIAIAAILRTVT